MVSAIARIWPKDRLTWRTRVNLVLLTPFVARIIGIAWCILGTPIAILLFLDRLVHSVIYHLQGREGMERVLTPEVSAALTDPRWGTHMSVKANGLRFHAVAKGEHGKPLVLFLHGFPENWYAWRHQLEALGSTGQYYCVAVDMRGFGESDKPAGVENYRIEFIVQDIVSIVRTLGYDTVTLVGHDWGGNVAWHTAHAYPTIVTRLVVMDFPHPVLTHVNYTLRQYFRSAYAFIFHVPVIPELVCTSFDFFFMDLSLRMVYFGMVHKDHMSSTDFQALKFLSSRKGAMESGVNYYRNIFTDRPPELLAAIMKPLQTPTLAIYGKRDAFLGVEMNDGLEMMVPDLSLQYIKDGSHWIQNDCPGAINNALRDFLAKRGTGACKLVQDAAREPEVDVVISQ